ncbi:MAG: EpsI family protein, partial [Phycisphaerae bacterium]|nr:EpsI family protein [Phycisphaerae bacterium]
DLPARLGPWVQVTVDERASYEMEEALGTREYISRDYVDSRIVPAALIEQFKGKKYAEQQFMLDKLRQTHPQAVMHMHIPYYTGMVDTVAHIPDRCYVADGFEPSAAVTSRWKCFEGRGDDRAAAKFIHFEDQVAGRRAVSRNVAYFFHVNGRYTSSSLDVRAELQNLLEKHGYYAKIELMMVLNDRDRAAAIMDEFLSHALPEVEKVLPDWKQVKSGQKSAAKSSP